MTQFNFVSLAQLTEDVVKWSSQLPYFDAVAGVPRSGLIPASIFAAIRNIRLIPLDVLISRPDAAMAYAELRESNPLVRRNVPYGNKVLVLDDATSDSSHTLNNLRERLAWQTHLDLTYGAVYRASESSVVDVYFREVPQLRMFEWNWKRHWYLRHALLDIDGVLCHDWEGDPETENDERAIEHISNARPLYLPDVPVMGLVTSRLEKYRELTEGWLKRHNVEYQKLTMHPAKTPEERRKLHDHAERKAAEYANHPDACVFIESDVRQAEKIHYLTGRPVLCIDTMQAFS